MVALVLSSATTTGLLSCIKAVSGRCPSHRASPKRRRSNRQHSWFTVSLLLDSNAGVTSSRAVLYSVLHGQQTNLVISNEGLSKVTKLAKAVEAVTMRQCCAVAWPLASKPAVLLRSNCGER